MNKIKASVAVIGFQKEDHRMYPHLYDFLQNLRNAFDEVIYIDDDDRGIGLYNVNLLLQNILSVDNYKKFLKKILKKIYSPRMKGNIYIGRIHGRNSESLRKCPPDADNLSVDVFIKNIGDMVAKIFSYVKGRRRLIKKIKNLHFKNDKNFVIAIDHTAGYFAGKYFSGNIIFWSHDILAKDAPLRIKDGILEKLITDKYASKAKILMIQDENRKKLLEESVGVSFPNTIYLPVSLNDSEFCRKASEKRRKRDSVFTVNIIQSGGIAYSRWSDQLIAAYQNWPSSYKLHLHGFICDMVKNKIRNVQRKPDVSEVIYDSDSLLQMLNNYDVGFVGYRESDSNHRYIENASSQMVMFLILGIPVIGCGSDLFNNFINKNNIGISIFSIGELEEAIKKIIDNYSFFSRNARNLYEVRFNLNNIFNDYLVKSFKTMDPVK